MYSKLLNALSIAIFLVLWNLASLAINSNFFPGPVETAGDFLNMFGTPEIYRHVFLTSLRTFFAVVLAGLAGMILLLLSKKFRLVNAFYGTVIYPLAIAVSPISWAFVAVVWFGLSFISPIFIVFAAILPVFLIALREGFNQLDNNLLEAARSFTRDKVRIFGKVMIPLLYPYIFSSFRIAVSAAWKVVILAEVFSSVNGIGFLLEIARETMNVTRIFSLTALMVILLAAFDTALKLSEKNIFRKWEHEIHRSK